MATKNREKAPQHAHPFLRGREFHVLIKKLQLEEKVSSPSFPCNAGVAQLIASDMSSDDDVYGGFPEPELVNQEEEKKLEAFMSNREPRPQLTLKAVVSNMLGANDGQIPSDVPPLPKLDASIIDLYKGVGKLLNKMIAGEVPKVFKHIPLLEIWEDVLYLTEPEKWSAYSVFKATEIFASNFGTKKAGRFYSLVLLPRIRGDIRKNKRLHITLYRALKESLSNPAAFNSGILFPLCESGTCTLREAVIVGSVIRKVSIPPLNSSVAIMKLAEMDYCGTTSYFIKLLLDKKHALPYRVLDTVVAHFVKFLEVTSVMPVIWHQSPLTFVQRFKNELTKEDKEKFENLLQHQNPNLVTVADEIRGELKDSCNRGENIHIL